MSTQIEQYVKRKLQSTLKDTISQFVMADRDGVISNIQFGVRSISADELESINSAFGPWLIRYADGTMISLKQYTQEAILVAFALDSVLFADDADIEEEVA